MQKSIWIFGAIAGVLCAVLEYLFFSSADSNFHVTFIAKIAILVISVGFGLVLIRKLLGGTISIARTVVSGLMISLVRALVMIIAFSFLYYPEGSFYQPKLEESFAQAAKQNAQDDNVKPADKADNLEQTQDQIAFQFKPKGYALIVIGSSLVTGLIASILMAAFIGTNMMYKELDE